MSSSFSLLPPLRHKSAKHANVCHSTKMMMLHVRDCTGLLHNGDACPFPWCGAVKHLLYHLVSCTDGDRCTVCNPPGDGAALGGGLRALAGLNAHRRARWTERARDESARAAAAAGPPSGAAPAGASDGAAGERAATGARPDDGEPNHVSFAAEPEQSSSSSSRGDDDDREEEHIEESDMSALPPEPVLGDLGPSEGRRDGHVHDDARDAPTLTKSLSQLSTLSSCHLSHSLSAGHTMPSPALSALAGLPSSLSVSGLPTLEEAAMELGDMGLSSSDLLAGVGESSGKLAHLG